uniref:Uncharacterized protein n=1 Tax=Micrurus corallinus TaxID=54390 RepID=A0A2D4F145_MICCO
MLCIYFIKLHLYATHLSSASPLALHWAARSPQILPCGCLCKPPFLALGWVWMKALHFLKVGGWEMLPSFPLLEDGQSAKCSGWCDPKPPENKSPLVEFDNYHNAINVAL